LNKGVLTVPTPLLSMTMTVPSPTAALPLHYLSSQGSHVLS
jgi:hypothetical protein